MMATMNEFERRRRERRMRERRRKKRIRAAIILIAFVCAVILIVIVCMSKCSPKQTGEPVQLGGDGTSETTLSPQDGGTPTAAPIVNPMSIPPASENNDLMDIIEDSGQEKRCYLTFDDGPTENITPQILDTLRRYNVKATFFEIGSLIQTNPSMARRVYEEGHLIANHSDGHNYAKLYVSTDTFMNEVNECYEAIKDVTGEAEPFKLVRFPGGGFNSSADSYAPVKQECKDALAEYGFYYCDWNALNGDAEGKTKDADELLDYLIDSIDGQDNIVVLMHDAAAKQATADALGSIIEYLRGEGYTFHRLDDIEYQTGTDETSPGEDSDSDSGYDEDSDYDSDYDEDSDENYDEDYDSDFDEDSDNSSNSGSPQNQTTAPIPSGGSSGGSTGPIIIQ